MRIFNEDKTQELQEYDLTKGYLYPDVLFDGNNFYEDIRVYKPYTEKELANNEIQECLQYLKDTDYITSKLAEAESEFIETGNKSEVIRLRQQYSDELANRKIKRERIRELENKLSL